MGRLAASEFGLAPRALMPDLGKPTSATEREVLMVLALENLDLPSSQSRPPVDAFVKSFEFYKPELLKLAYGHGLRPGEELTVESVFASKPRHPFEME